MEFLITLKCSKMTTRNVKKVKITIPDERILWRCKNTPTFSRLSRLDLKIGENIEYVNHKQFADMKRLYPIGGVGFEEIKEG